MPICTECKQEKEFNCFYKHPQTKDGITHRCKECVLNGRKTEKELVMARKRDNDRYYNKPKRRLYQCWRGINDRVKTGGNGRYLDNGIKNLWNNFEQFYSDMLNLFETHKKKYGIENTTIERIDNLGHYCKENCKFATYKEQNNNRSDNCIIIYNGKRYTKTELSQKLGISYTTLTRRIKQQKPF